jgi:hypothetical protein
MADFPGDIDLTLNWQPDVELKLVRIDDEASSHALVSLADNSSVRILPVNESWSIKDVKDILREGKLQTLAIVNLRAATRLGSPCICIDGGGSSSDDCRCRRLRACDSVPGPFSEADRREFQYART